MCSKRMNVYIKVWEVRGQVSGTTRGMARTKSAINNSQASGYIRALRVARGIGTNSPHSRTPAAEPPQGRRVGCTVRCQSLAPHRKMSGRAFLLPKMSLRFSKWLERYCCLRIVPSEIVMTRVTENSVSTIEFYRLFLTKCNGLCWDICWKLRKNNKKFTISTIFKGPHYFY